MYLQPAAWQATLPSPCIPDGVTSAAPPSPRSPLQLSCQILHRKRPGATDGLTKEQRRLHLAGKMLHDFVTGELPPGGSQLVR